VAESESETAIQEALRLLQPFVRPTPRFPVPDPPRMMEIFQSVMSSQGTSSAQSARSDQLVQLLSSLPDRLANRLSGLPPPEFVASAYFQVLSSAVLAVSASLVSERSEQRVFMGRVLGKICVVGHGDIVARELLQSLWGDEGQSDFASRHAALLSQVPENHVEQCLTAIVLRLPAQPACESPTHISTVAVLLKDLLRKSTTATYVLTSKLTTQRVLPLPCIRVLLSVLACHTVLADVPSAPSGPAPLPLGVTPLFALAFKNLLDVWNDGSAVKHLSAAQHRYITHGLRHCLALISAMPSPPSHRLLLESLGAVPPLLTGVQVRLSSPDINVRRFAMTTAEQLSLLLDPENPLQFEPETGPMTDDDADVTGALLDANDITMADLTDRAASSSSLPSSTAAGGVQVAQNGHESDGLTAYDLTEEVVAGKVKAPRYLRDCLKSLRSSQPEHREQQEAALIAAERLIRSDPDELDELCVPLAVCLLHLQDVAEGEHAPRRLGALVALCVHCPYKVAPFLTREFYRDNLTLQTRGDVLDVMTAAATELSSVKGSTPSLKKASNPAIAAPSPSRNDAAQIIIAARLEQKTRRFHSTVPPKGPLSEKNKFHALAPTFFYPLLNQYDHSRDYFWLLGEDFFLLGKLINSLAVFLECSENGTSARDMASTLVQLVWALRFHDQAYVRRALVFALTRVAVLPTHVILPDLLSELTELHSWLRDTMKSDEDAVVQSLAAAAMQLLFAQLQAFTGAVQSLAGERN